MDLPSTGRPVEDVLADLVAKRADDARWADGRTFGLVYDGGPSVHEVAERAAAAYLHENALNTHAFPSLASIQNEVVAWTAELLHAPPTAAGFLTSGGTESIQCAVLAARDAAGPSAASPPARSWSPNRRTPRSTSRHTCSACRSSPCR